MAGDRTHPCCYHKKTVRNAKYGLFALAGNIDDFEFYTFFRSEAVAL